MNRNRRRSHEEIAVLQVKLAKVMQGTYHVPREKYSEWCILARDLGAIPKSKLKDGAYYYGRCRNAYVAKWNAGKVGKVHSPTGQFTYMRTKFSSTFPEDINHFEDDNGFDLFVPIQEVEPEPHEEIPDEKKGPDDNIL